MYHNEFTTLCLVQSKQYFYFCFEFLDRLCVLGNWVTQYNTFSLYTQSMIPRQNGNLNLRSISRKKGNRDITVNQVRENTSDITVKPFSEEGYNITVKTRKASTEAYGEYVAGMSQRMTIGNTRCKASRLSSHALTIPKLMTSHRKQLRRWPRSKCVTGNLQTKVPTFQLVNNAYTVFSQSELVTIQMLTKYSVFSLPPPCTTSSGVG